MSTPVIFAVAALIAASTVHPSVHEQLGAGVEPALVWVFFEDKGPIDHAAALAELAQTYDARAVERRRLRRTAPGLFDEREPVTDLWAKRLSELPEVLSAQPDRLAAFLEKPADAQPRIEREHLRGVGELVVATQVGGRVDRLLERDQRDEDGAAHQARAQDARGLAHGRRARLRGLWPPFPSGAAGVRSASAREPSC